MRIICDSIRIASTVASASIRRRVAADSPTTNFQELCRDVPSNKIDASLDDIVVTISDLPTKVIVKELRGSYTSEGGRQATERPYADDCDSSRPSEA